MASDWLKIIKKNFILDIMCDDGLYIYMARMFLVSCFFFIRRWPSPQDKVSTKDHTDPLKANLTGMFLWIQDDHHCYFFSTHILMWKIMFFGVLCSISLLLLVYVCWSEIQKGCRFMVFNATFNIISAISWRKPYNGYNHRALLNKAILEYE